MFESRALKFKLIWCKMQETRFAVFLPVLDKRGLNDMNMQWNIKNILSAPEQVRFWNVHLSKKHI